jgi:hypothetical protein
VPKKHLSLNITRHDTNAVAHCGWYNEERCHHATE